ncbi:MAG: NADP-dependent phosphogluconate dehydrogenase, partial [Rhodoferax sp.]|nr:NADP-dependent phosphogluconate dehydrogenase [Rhodoferax sp.]
TDSVIDELARVFEPGDIIIDGGNAHWLDTIRREKELKARGLRFVGCGVSGGEEGARFGPSLMPGGEYSSWQAIEPIWKAIAAKVDAKSGVEIKGGAPGRPVQGGVPCAAYIGADGAGHYVKMVHNGIEYGDMQMICESYDILRRVLGLSAAEIGLILQDWNSGILNSFLVEISAEVLRHVDPVTGKAFVDVVLDTAGSKGTGLWTSVSALEFGVPAPTIGEAVFARYLSAVKEERVAASKILDGPVTAPYHGDRKGLIDAVRDALYCAKICSYAQGFQLLDAAQKKYGWKLDFGEIAKIFRGGCIIRAGFLQKITEAYGADPGLKNLLLDPYFSRSVQAAQGHWRTVIAVAVMHGVPVPTLGSALSYYDSYRSAVLPQNLLQGQRDFFGAHTYERTDAPRGKFFHIDWPAPGRPQREV